MNNRITFFNGLLSALVALAFTTAPASAAPLLHYDGKNCGYEFDYPADWKVTPLPEENRRGRNGEAHPPESCLIQLRPRRIGDHAAAVEDYTLELGGFNGTFLRAAELVGFDFYMGSWTTRGRQGTRNSATVLNNRQWSGLKGVGVVGCRLDPTPGNGPELALCDEERAVLQDPYDHVWMVRGGGETDEAFETLLFTFRTKE